MRTIKPARVVLCSFATGRHHELLDLAFPTFRDYAERWGWDRDIETIWNTDWTRPASWYKIDRILHLFDEGYDVVIWVDADCMVLDPSQNILVDHDAHYPLWLAEHRISAVDHRWLPNCGVMVCYNDTALIDFLQLAWQQEQWINHPWWEQAAILDLLGWEIERPGALAYWRGRTEWTGIMGSMSTRWNSMQNDPHPAPVIKHWSGMPFDTRLGQMREQAKVMA